MYECTCVGLHKTSKYSIFGIFFKCIKYHSTRNITLKVMTRGKEVPVDVLQIDTVLEM